MMLGKYKYVGFLDQIRKLLVIFATLFVTLLKRFFLKNSKLFGTYWFLSKMTTRGQKSVKIQSLHPHQPL